MIMDAAGGVIEGRTVIQKLAYFSGLGLGVTLEHRPHYYGPYSSKVEDALTLATVAEDLHETAERMPAWNDSSPDIVKYTYALTELGKGKVQELREAHPSEGKRVRSAVEAIRSVIPDLNQKTLSSAAKTYLIISETEGGLDESQIPGLANRLGWKLAPAEVERTVSILRHLGLVAVDNDDGPAQPAVPQTV